MPRIPQNFRPGFATVQPALGGAATPQGSSWEGVRQIGQTIFQGESQALHDETMANVEARRGEEQAAREAMREREREAKAAAREAEQERRRISRIEAGNAAVGLELDTIEFRDALGQDLRSGKLKPDEYQAKLQGFISERAGKYREQLDPATHVDFEQAMIRPARMAQIEGMKAIRDHLKDQAVATFDQADERLQRIAITDPDRAIANASALYGPQGDVAAMMGVDVASKRLQGFTEKAVRTHYLAALESVRDNPKGLANLHGKIAGDKRLDPTQQTAMLQSIDSRTSVLENRGRAAAERYERKQRQAFDALQTLSDQGLPMDPKFVAQQMGVLKGSALGQAAAAVISGSTATAAFGSKSVADMDAIIQAEMQKARAGGVDPNTSKHLQKLKTIRNSAESAYREDPWRAASDRGQIDAIPKLDSSSIPALVTSLQGRLQAAEALDGLAGKTVSPLRPQEASELADTLQSLGVPERSKLLGHLYQTVGSQRMLALSEQLKSKDDGIGIVAAYKASGLKTQGGHDLGELYLRGDQALKDKTVKVDDRAETGTRATIAKQLRGAFASESAERAAIDATMKVWAGLNASGKATSAEEAITVATGGTMERNGGKFVRPYGWSEKDVDKALSAVTPEHVTKAAGGAVKLSIGTQEMLTEDVPRMLKQAQLRPAGQGRYAVVLGERMLMANGRPFTMALPDVR